MIVTDQSAKRSIGRVICRYDWPASWSVQHVGLRSSSLPQELSRTHKMQEIRNQKHSATKPLKPDATDQAGIYSCFRPPLDTILRDDERCAAAKLKKNSVQKKTLDADEAWAAAPAHCSR